VKEIIKNQEKNNNKMKPPVTNNLMTDKDNTAIITKNKVVKINNNLIEITKTITNNKKKIRKANLLEMKVHIEEGDQEDNELKFDS